MGRATSRTLLWSGRPKLYERATMSMDAIPLVGLVFGVLVAIALSHLCGLARQAYLTIGKGQPREANDAE
jgi:hypothetical protein